MRFDLETIYDTLTNGRNLEDATPGEPVEISGCIDGFPIPCGGKITYILQNSALHALKIEYGETLIEVGNKYVTLFSVPETMGDLIKFLDRNIIKEQGDDFNEEKAFVKSIKSCA